METVEIILDNSRHLVRLLNDLLDLARSDAGRLAIQPQPTEVGAADRRRGADDAAQTEGADQALTPAGRARPALINAEPDRIRQVLVNLLTNAHEYWPEGASIGVTATPRRCRSGDRVSDNGPGIPEDQLEHIFERFTRGDAGLTQRVGGTGLGLAISKSLVELHGGTIEADSTPGAGSTFRIRLPALGTDGPHADQAAAEEAADGQDPGRRRLRDDPAAAADPSGDGGLRGRDRRRRPGGDRGPASHARRATGPTSSCSTR